jgi:hypothetical protein
MPDPVDFLTGVKKEPVPIKRTASKATVNGASQEPDQES